RPRGCARRGRVRQQRSWVRPVGPGASPPDRQARVNYGCATEASPALRGDFANPVPGRRLAGGVCATTHSTSLKSPSFRGGPVARHREPVGARRATSERRPARRGRLLALLKDYLPFSSLAGLSSFGAAFSSSLIGLVSLPFS